MERRELDGENVFVIDDFLSEAECRDLIARAESLGFGAALVGDVLAQGLRDNSRVMVDDPALAAELWAKAAPFLPAEIDGWKAVRLNERFRFYRYDVAEKFAPHYDGSIWLGLDEESKLTFMVYLNEGFRGGETKFYRPDAQLRFAVEPRRGTALIFAHQQLHEGAAVQKGRKYVLRSDVMYRQERQPKPTAPQSDAGMARKSDQ